MNKQCECCLSPNNLIEFTDDHVNLIVSCFSIEISSICTFDKSLNYICNMCAVQIKDCFKFRSQILISQIKLKKKYSSIINDNMDLEPNKSIAEPDPFKQEFLSDCDDTHDFDNSIDKNSMSPEETLDFQMDPESDSNEPLITQVKSTSYDTMPDSNNSSIEKRTTRSQRNLIVPIQREVELNSSNTNNSIQKEGTSEFDDIKEPNPSEKPKKVRKTITIHSQLHLRMKLNSKKCACDICGKELKNNHILRQHMRVHLDYTRCTICGKLVKPSYLSRHVQSHSGKVEYFKCKLCPEILRTHSQRCKHMMSIHQVDIRKYCCESCPKKYYSPKQLRDHVDRSHLKKLTVPCDICGLMCFNVYEMNLHKISHSDEKKFSCNFCNKRYKRKSHLQEHLYFHTGKLKCEHCDLEFTNRSYLLKHKRNKHANLQL